MAWTYIPSVTASDHVLVIVVTLTLEVGGKILSVTHFHAMDNNHVKL